MAEDKTHLSIVICGHVDAGKSTTTGRLIFELGGIDERELQKLKDEAKILGKESFAFAFYMDKSAEERNRGVTIACTTKEFYTESYHYTIIDAPVHRDIIKNMISGASQADVALLMIPADGNFTAALAKPDHKAGIVQGQSRQHARLLNLLGVNQFLVGINKMDCDTAAYGNDRYVEVRDEVKRMLKQVGTPAEKIDNCIPYLPLSGWVGDNLIEKSTNMDWWTGMDIAKRARTKAEIKAGTEVEKVHVDTLLDCLEKLVVPPRRDDSKPLRMPVSGVYNIKGVGMVITGRVEQGKVTKDLGVCFLPTHQDGKLDCKGKVFSIEMHHKQHAEAHPGDNVGLNIKGLNKDLLPRAGDVMCPSDVGGRGGLSQVSDFTAQVQVLDHPGELKIGYTPIAFIRTGRAACRMSKIVWKMGKSTGKQKVDFSEDASAFLKKNEVGEVVFEPQSPFVAESFKVCEGMGRVAIMEGNGVVMLGKVTKVTPGGVIARTK
jgi:elongation factor 1-alpha